jgi:hypothetical protein
LVRQDGAVRWVSATGSFYYSKTGKPERMLGNSVDITERKCAEEGLKKSEEKRAETDDGVAATTLRSEAVVTADSAASGWEIVHLLTEVHAFLFLLTGDKGGALGNFGFASPSSKLRS